MAQRWEEGLSAAGLGGMVEGIEDGGGGVVVVRVRGGEAGAVGQVSGWLAGRGEVVWVQRRAVRRLLAPTVTLHHAPAPPDHHPAALRNLHAVPALLGALHAAGEPLVWAQGLRGQGQVLAVADTGRPPPLLLRPMTARLSGTARQRVRAHALMIPGRRRPRLRQLRLRRHLWLAPEPHLLLPGRGERS